MKDALIKMIFVSACLLTLASDFVPVAASTTISRNADIDPPRVSGLLTDADLASVGPPVPALDEFTQVAVNRIIRVGPRSSVRRPDKCYVTINGDRYYAEALTEQVARERLATITDQYAYCRRERERFED